MIKKFNTYNESLRNKLKGKKLTDIKLEIYNVKEQLDSLGLRTTKEIEINNGIYSFNMNYIMDIHISLHYYDYKKMENNWSDKYLSSHKNGWNVYIVDDNNKQNNDYLTGTWDKILLKIISVCYSDIDSIIINTKKRIEDFNNQIELNKNFLNGLENAKKILNDN